MSQQTIVKPVASRIQIEVQEIVQPVKRQHKARLDVDSDGGDATQQ